MASSAPNNTYESLPSHLGYSPLDNEREEERQYDYADHTLVRVSTNDGGTAALPPQLPDREREVKVTTGFKMDNSGGGGGKEDDAMETNPSYVTSMSSKDASQQASQTATPNLDQSMVNNPLYGSN